MRVINEKGEQLGILPTQDAIRLAEQAGLKLVEVNPKASPPVCKIMDYGKFKYETSKRDRETKKNQKTSEVKEVKFRPKTHGHDFDFKVRHVRRFLDDGDKVRLVVQFRGREMVHPETGQDVLERVCKAIADVALIVQASSLEGNRMGMVVGPKPRRPEPRRPSVKSGEGGAAGRPAGPGDGSGEGPATEGEPGDLDDEDEDDDEDDDDLDDDDEDDDDDDSDDDGDAVPADDAG